MVFPIHIEGGITIENGVSIESSPPVIVTPTPTSASPTSGPNSGGTAVVLSGSGFTGVTSMDITFPGYVSNPVNIFTVDSDIQISFISPNNSYVPGPGYVINVTNSAGTGTLPGWIYT